MNPDERQRLERAMAKTSRERKEVEADPAAAMQASLAAAMAQARRRLLWILFWIAVAALAVGFGGRMLPALR